jgi:bacteriocin-like protein
MKTLTFDELATIEGGFGFIDGACIATGLFGAAATLTGFLSPLGVAIVGYAASACIGYEVGNFISRFI